MANRDLCADAGAGSAHGRRASHAQSFRRPTHRDPLGQQHRAFHARPGGDVGRHSVLSRVACLLAGGGRSRKTSVRDGSAHAGAGRRFRYAAFRARVVVRTCGRGDRRRRAVARSAGVDARLARARRRRARGGSARGDRCGFDREIPADVRIHRPSQGGDHHQPHVLQQRRDAAAVHAFPRAANRPCCSTGCRGTIPLAAATTSGMVLAHGGSLYIDDGRPTPAGIAETLRNLREISPTVYFNVPKGFEMLAPHLRDDAAAAQEVLFAAAGVLLCRRIAGATHLGRAGCRLDPRARSPHCRCCPASARPRPALP